ncbi:anthranilate synthase alpha subunit 1 chloroplastic [Phtheirospermum japonicum]|uniref:Anthranilate synthase alpha subunit 1 chloroplastic n=1 Tax=Phtheirospermum japonicum TaxID=374723 RepID=A0A830BW17_9LAMI|nr:anthranilate synthase alpha subunit 1 chloroplastic [Phtheirospermum japonicum]
MEPYHNPKGIRYELVYQNPVHPRHRQDEGMGGQAFPHLKLVNKEAAAGAIAEEDKLTEHDEFPEDESEKKMEADIIEIYRKEKGDLAGFEHLRCVRAWYAKGHVVASPFKEFTHEIEAEVEFNSALKNQIGRSEHSSNRSQHPIAYLRRRPPPSTGETRAPPWISGLAHSNAFIYLGVYFLLEVKRQLVDEKRFSEASQNGSLIPLFKCIFSDHLTPVLAYRCLVKEDDREAPSFLFETVEPGYRASNVGRYSIVGAQPTMEVVAKENKVTILDHDLGTMVEKIVDDPMTIPRSISEGWRPQLIQDLPEALCGGWVGFFSYDTVWYVEKKKLPFSNAPKDDRNLADIHLGLYDDVIVFDHVDKLFTDVAPKTAENFRALCTGEKGAALKLGSHFTIKEPFLIALSKDTWLRADDHDCMSCDIVLRQGTCFGKTVTMEKAYTVGSFQVLKLEDVEPKDGEIRVKNKAIGLNFIDVYFRKGVYKLSRMYFSRTAVDFLRQFKSPTFYGGFRTTAVKIYGGRYNGEILRASMNSLRLLWLGSTQRFCAAILVARRSSGQVCFWSRLRFKPQVQSRVCPIPVHLLDRFGAQHVGGLNSYDRVVLAPEVRQGGVQAYK